LPCYWLDFAAPGCRRISYGGCIGQQEQSPEMLAQSGALWQRMEHLSVRNQMTFDMVKALSGRDPALVLDPTFYCDFAKQGGEVKPPFGGDYILAYALSQRRDGLMDQVLGQAREALGLPVVAMAPTPVMRNLDRRLVHAGPDGFLDLFRAARFVVTDSFHGTVFSIKSRKPFFSVRGFRPGRVDDLLQRSGLVSRSVSQENMPSLAQRLAQQVDYEAVDAALAPALAAGRKFMDEALQGL
jgi:hypothetical protein